MCDAGGKSFMDAMAITGPTKLKNISGDGRTYFLTGYLKIRYVKNPVMLNIRYAKNPVC